MTMYLDNLGDIVEVVLTVLHPVFPFGHLLDNYHIIFVYIDMYIVHVKKST